MGWRIGKVNRNETNSQVLALLHNGRSNLIAVVSPNHDQPDSLENRVISALGESRSGEQNDPQERGESLVVEAVELAEDEGFFSQADLRSHSVLYIRTRDGSLHAQLTQETESYSKFCSLLRPPNKIVPSKDDESDIALENSLAPYEDIIYDRPLASWRMTSTKVSLASSPGDEFVYKGITFYHFLLHGPENFRHEVDAIYREIQLVNHTIPPHPNIIPPAKYLVYAGSSHDDGSERLLCGSLYVFFTGGSLADLLDRTSRDRTRFSLSQKAKWCYQLCSAMTHVHYRARCWHQDLKPPNILLDDNENLLLVDWEQCGAAPFIIAPEADGSFDVRELDEEVNGRRRLSYPHYEGPKRINTHTKPEWNVFPDWIRNHPRAAELAEVYSLGKTMWIILEQVGLEHEPGVTDYSTQTVQWSSWSGDIPTPWRRIVEASIADDPNDRPLMSELLQFWEKEWQKHQSTFT